MERQAVTLGERGKSLPGSEPQTGIDDGVTGVGSSFVEVGKEAMYSIGADDVIDPFRTEAVAAAMLARFTFRAVIA